MQKHIKNRLESKWFDWTESYYNCAVCWCNNWVDVHHIKYRSQWWSDDASNLIMLCRQCHTASHNWEIPDSLLHELK